MNTRILIRQASMKDKDSIIQLLNKLHGTDKSSWIEIMMDGRHPYTDISNFIIAEDTETKSIIGNATMMPWRYLYDGKPIHVTRIEEVIIDTEYRGRGISRRILDYIHKLSEEQDTILQVVFGRPGFYKHHGYTLSLPNEEEGMEVALRKADAITNSDRIKFTIEESAEDDLPFIQLMLDNIHDRNMICTYIKEKELYYTKYVYDEHTINVIKDTSGNNVGIMNHYNNKNVYWLEISKDISYYELRSSLMNYFLEKGIAEVKFKLGANHPFYQFLGDYCTRKLLTISGYARIPDIPKFLLSISDVLDERIAQSDYRGFSGSIDISLHNKLECYSLIFENGKIISAEAIDKGFGDVRILRSYLVQLILGRKSAIDLQIENAEVHFTNSDFMQLMSILFPNKDSYVFSLN